MATKWKITKNEPATAGKDAGWDTSSNWQSAPATAYQTQLQYENSRQETPAETVHYNFSDDGTATPYFEDYTYDWGTPTVDTTPSTSDYQKAYDSNSDSGSSGGSDSSGGGGSSGGYDTSYYDNQINDYKNQISNYQNQINDYGGQVSALQTQLSDLQAQQEADRQAAAEEAQKQANALRLANEAAQRDREAAKAERERLINDYTTRLETARQNAINSANEALDTQGRNAEDQYNLQLDDIGTDYEDLRRQSEVNRYKAMIRQRESLANQGRLDSGAGRQEYLTLANNFNNNLNKINLQERKESDRIKQAIASMWSNIASQKAANQNATLDNYANTLNSLLSLESANNYTPSTSDYYNAALALANTAPYTTPAVLNANGESNPDNTAARVMTLDDLLQFMGYNG